MPRTKARWTDRKVRRRMRRKVERGYKRKGPTVAPTAEQLWRKVLELNLDIGLACDVETRRSVWDTSIDLTAEVDAPAVYMATGVITGPAGEGGAPSSRPAAQPLDPAGVTPQALYDLKLPG